MVETGEDSGKNKLNKQLNNALMHTCHIMNIVL